MIIFWILLGIVLIIFLYKKLISFSIAKNVTQRYYALKDMFANDGEISNVRLLEMAGVFSQIVDVKNNQVLIKDITDAAIEAQNGGEDRTEKDMLCDFCYELTILVGLGSGLPYTTAMDFARKELKSIEKDVNSIAAKGYKNIINKSNLSFIAKNPGCLSGNYIYQ